MSHHPAAGLHLVRRRDRVRARPTRTATSSSRAARRRTSSGCCSSARRRTASDVVQVLEDYKRAWSDQIKVFQLQRRIVGVEVAAGAFFNGHEFVSRSASTSSTRSCFPATSARPPARWARRCSGASPTRSSTPTLRKMEPKLARGALRRLHRRQLHRQRQRHLSARVHGALRLPDDQHPAGGPR